ncbi:decaprenyl-phosphate phosphoribosyltransferase [Blastococcus haudaquaticus]|uniref:Decaprenyl-phosphate phosphoribosyltransferase n=1 Tax=Blastococcus haudaquaticus TaxID=1938745 RepID=A0A286GGD3_9ACTN|nr:decaprenyl-phosphate phosphoribosyltransferase [Blastococcus haudaquaticus]SOD94558.1 decaprenyl-phosphate phosphoribosyltransferase [Blastococcus haudaquaticus]
MRPATGVSDAIAGERTLHRTSASRALIQALRVRQWPKNGLVVAAPLAAGVLFRPEVLLDTAIALVAFVLASSGTYLLNDVGDVDADRLHPTKRHRPIARGDLPLLPATIAGVALLLAAVLLPALTGHYSLAACIATYTVLTSLYSRWLKHEPVVDLAVVAAGFLLRAMAGGLAAGLELSPWFLTVASFGSLYIVAGKRYSEMVNLGDDGPSMRPCLEQYSASYLRFVWSIAAAVLVATYCLWAFEVSHSPGMDATVPWLAFSVAPFVVGVLRYALNIDRGAAGTPEDIVLSDRGLQVVGLVWLSAFTCGALGV